MNTKNVTLTHEYLSLKWTVVISTVLSLPFMLLQWLKQGAFSESFSLKLFGLTWLLSAASILTLIPIGQDLLAGKRLTANPMRLLVRLFFFILVAGLWAGLVINQWPCFLGVGYCG